MRYYPIFLKLEGKECLVVGAGQVGRRKVETMLGCGPEKVVVVDIRKPDDDFAALLDHPALDYQCREFDQSDLDGKFLVVASTSNEELNWLISNLCKERNIPCNIVDQPEKCSFIVPAMFTEGDLTMAVSTGGQSPALAKRIRKSLKDYFGKEYGRFLDLMGLLRPEVLKLDNETEVNSEMFRNLVNSELLTLIQKKDRAGAEKLMAEILPDQLKTKIPELLNGIV